MASSAQIRRIAKRIERVAAQLGESDELIPVGPPFVAVGEPCLYITMRELRQIMREIDGKTTGLPPHTHDGYDFMQREAVIEGRTP